MFLKIFSPLFQTLDLHLRLDCEALLFVRLLLFECTCHSTSLVASLVISVGEEEREEDREEEREEDREIDVAFLLDFDTNNARRT